MSSMSFTIAQEGSISSPHRVLLSTYILASLFLLSTCQDSNCLVRIEPNHDEDEPIAVTMRVGLGDQGETNKIQVSPPALGLHPHSHRFADQPPRHSAFPQKTSNPTRHHHTPHHNFTHCGLLSPPLPTHTMRRTSGSRNARSHHFHFQHNNAHRDE